MIACYKGISVGGGPAGVGNAVNETVVSRCDRLEAPFQFPWLKSRFGGAPFDVRGAPCITVPGKRAGTAKMCESNEYYVPLNDGYNWRGDPNATLSGQSIPQLPPGSPPAQAAPPPGPARPPIAAGEYDPATGTYVGPDGRVYTQSNLARVPTEEQTWPTMLLPPTGN